MKVALLCNNYPPEFRGGTELVVQALAAALMKLGEEPLVVCGSERGVSQDGGPQEVVEEHDAGVRVLRLPLAPDEAYGLDVARPRITGHVLALLQQNDVELVHVHHWSHLSDRLLQEARGIGVPGLCTLHDMWTSCPRFFREPPPGAEITCPSGTEREPCIACVNLDYGADPALLAEQIGRRDENIARELAAAVRVTAPSGSCAAGVRRHTGFAGAIEVIPHGLLAPAPAAAVRSEPRAVHVPFRVGTFGNLVPAKGLDDLVQAMAASPGAELHLHGHFPDPAYADRLRERAARLSVRLHVHGPYGPGDSHGPDRPHPAAGLDLAVFFSRCEETYGLVVEEALAHGTPVIVSDRGAMPERVGGGGVVVPNGDVALLQEQIARIVQDPGAHSRLRSEIPRSFPTILDAAERYRDLYADALAGR